MHELAIAQNILSIAMQHAEAAGARRITDIYLVIGSLASVVDDSLQFHWDMISQGTTAQGARLHFERLSVRMRCQICGYSYQPAGEDMACPQCGSRQVMIEQGDEFRLEAIEIDT